MPYASVEDLPAAFKNLPAAAKKVAMETMNAVLRGKQETTDVITQALRAAWANIKRKFRRGGGGEWVEKGMSWIRLTKVGNPYRDEGGQFSSPVGQGWVRLRRKPPEQDEEADEGESDDDGMESGAVAKTIRLLKSDVERGLVYGVVLEPRTADDPDAQRDWYTAEEVEKAAHGFMRAYRLQKSKIGLQHKGDAEAEIVESYVAPVEFKVGEETVRAGSWMMAAYLADEGLRKQVREGKLGGWSIGGKGERL